MTDHLVQRQIVEIRSTSRALTELAQTTYLDLWERTLVGRLDRLFSEFAPGPRVRFLDRLEVDLGSLSSEQLTALLPDRLEEAMRHGLQRRLGHPPDVGQKTPELSECAPISTLRVIFFLAEGRLPWWSPAATLDELGVEFDSLVCGRSAELATWLCATGPARRIASRVAQQLGERRAIELVTLLNPALVERVQAVLRVLLSSTNPKAPKVQRSVAEPPDGWGTLLWSAALFIAERVIGRPGEIIDEALVAAVPARHRQVVRTVLYGLRDNGDPAEPTPRDRNLVEISVRDSPNTTSGLQAAVSEESEPVDADFDPGWRETLSRPPHSQAVDSGADGSVVLGDDAEPAPPPAAGPVRPNESSTRQKPPPTGVVAAGEPQVAARAALFSSGRREAQRENTDAAPISPPGTADTWRDAPSGPQIRPPTVAVPPDVGQTWRSKSSGAQIPTHEDSPPTEGASRHDEGAGLFQGNVSDSAAIRPQTLRVGSPATSDMLSATAFSEAIPALHSGLVLIWPFLSRLFHRQGYRDGEGWCDEGSSIRAAHFIFYVVAGGSLAPEPEMLLPKLLCGIPLDQSVPLRMKLSDEERRAGHQLLADVVTHWTALGSTSPEGLRRAFLQRPGLLESRGQDWLLRIERQTHDLLLERLPWGVSTVRFPWTPYTLQVEW